MSGRQDVAADDGEVGRRFLDRRLLDQVLDLVDPAAHHVLAERLGVDDAVAADVAARHALDGQDRALHQVEHVDHLLQRRRVGVDDVVAEDDRERLVADEGAGHSTAWPRPSGSPCRT